MNNYRYEIKFVLDESSYSDALQWLYVSTNAVNRYPDRYINTIYLDNPDYESVRDNLAGISDRLKVRIRWYDGDPVVNLEKKMRRGRLGRKETTPLDLGEDFSSELSPLVLRNRINNMLYNKTELNDDYYTSILGVRYLRKYFEDQVGFRVTFDEKIQFCDLHDEIEPFYLSNGLVNYEPKVMEIKFDPSIKDYVANLVRKLNMTPKRHSKYLAGMAHLGNVVYI
jgi:hypothetical protein